MQWAAAPVFLALLAVFVSTSATPGSATFRYDTAAAPSVVSFNLSEVAAENLAGVFEVTLDVGTLTDGTACNLSDPVVVNLVRQMNYSYIRVGGTEGDFTYYAMNDSSTHFPMPAPPPPFTRRLTAGVWDWFMSFSRAVGARVLFGLNAGPYVRDGAGAWTSGMARDLVNHNAVNHPGVMGGYEFGNEPDLYPVNFKGYFPNGSQWAQDMRIVRALLNQYEPELLTLCCDVMYTPLLGSLLPIEKEFVAAGGLESTNVTTWHYYPLFAKKMDRYIPQWLDIYYATPERLAMPLTLNEAHKWASRASDDASPAASQVWLGETASASFGGQVNVSDSWVDAMAAIDKAGLITRLGQQRAFRQEICASHGTTSSSEAEKVKAPGHATSPPYTLLDAQNRPRPTYYAMWLFRRLVGDRAFASTSSADENGLRAYAYAAAAPAAPPSTSAADEVVVTVVNPGNDTRTSPTMCFAAGSPRPAASGAVASVYEVTACDRELTGKHACVNGAMMAADPSTGAVSPLPPAASVPILPVAGSNCFTVGGDGQMAAHSVWFIRMAVA